MTLFQPEVLLLMQQRLFQPEDLSLMQLYLAVDAVAFVGVVAVPVAG